MKKKTKLLYVDDEEALRILVKNQLVLEGFTVDTADDGDTALEMIKKNGYDVILLDIRMPRVNGIEVLDHLRKMKTRSRIIMLTAVDDLTVAVEAVKHGASDYLTKPFLIEDVLASIARVLAT